MVVLNASPIPPRDASGEQFSANVDGRALCATRWLCLYLPRSGTRGRLSREAGAASVVGPRTGRTYSKRKRLGDLSARKQGSAVVEQVLVVACVAGVLFVITTGVVVVVVARGVRRRYRSLRDRLSGFFPSSHRDGTGPTRVRSVALSTVGAPGWWAVQNHRHRMWRAVCSAEHSVAVARRSDVAVGDLPALATQLRAAASRADAVLCVSARSGSLREEDRANCERIEAAAAGIDSAALSSLRSVSRKEADPVVSAVQIEVAALAAGVKSAYR